MTPWMRKTHKWLALLIGLQVALWMCSGVVMSLLDAKAVKGQAYRVPPGPPKAWPDDVLTMGRVLATATAPVRSIRTGWLLDEPVYRLTLEKKTVLISARDGRPREMEAALAQRIAAASYRGPGQPGPAQLVPRSLETRAHAGPAWQVPFADEQDTTVWVSPLGDVLEHRNRSWRLFDFFWMLHIMDYSERKDFNSPWLVGIAIGAFWLSVSGIWLLCTSFRRADFVPRRWRAARTIGLFTPEGRPLRAVAARRGDTVFRAMALAGLPLPSNCGGGQSCALCEVRVRSATPPPPTVSDRAQLGALKLQAGHRLACNLAVDRDLQIEVRGAAQLAKLQHARVASVRDVAPQLREVVLQPEGDLPNQLWPGCYLQLQVPPYTLTAEQIALPPAQRAALQLPARWRNREGLRRSYSLSLPTAQAGGAVTLLVRLMAGSGAPPGRGSSWVYALRPGDRVQFSGPHGDFALRRNRREKFFVGGGAGMAPLRAMLHALLAGGAREPIHFCYGARSVAEAPYLDEMKALAAQHANFGFDLVISGDAAGGDASQVRRGLVHEAAEAALRARNGGLGGVEFYLCGPPPMLAATRAMLARLGVAEADIAFDDFKI